MSLRYSDRQLALAMPDQEDLRRRLRAARAVAGFSRVEDLAALIPEDERLGTRTLYDLERGAKPIRRPHLTAVAKACNLPVEFFYVDFGRLAELVDDPSSDDVLATSLARAHDRLDLLVEAVSELAGGQLSASLRAARDAAPQRRGEPGSGASEQGPPA